MRLKVYTIHDKLAARHGQPFCVSNTEMACRQFVTMLQSQAGASSYDLYYIGVYDDETGSMLAEDRMLVLAGADAASWRPPSVDDNP